MVTGSQAMRKGRCENHCLTGGGVNRSAICAVGLLACAAGAAWAGESTASDDIAFAEALRSHIERVLATDPGSTPGEPLHETAALARFYSDRADRPAWVEGRRVRHDLGGALLEAVQHSVRHGLRPRAYHVEALTRALEGGDGGAADRLANADLLFSDAFLHLAHDLANGAVDPRLQQQDYERAPDRVPDAANALASALNSGGIDAVLARMAPPHPEYAALVRALERLRAASAAGDSKAAARADQVRANLERWRWLPRDLGRRHLRVNIPDFTLRAFDAEKALVTMRVVVGEPGWTTPLAHGAISYLVLNPAWNVPKSIATREMLPAARRDRGYFRAKGIQILVDEEKGGVRVLDSRRIDWRSVDAGSFPYRLRQSPGPLNPLGRIKFMFANPYGVYLHGTPGDLAFVRPIRALSHGCVRVEDEIALALFALAPDPAWTRERLLESLRSAWEYRLPLPEPIPVHLLYFTADAAPEGTAMFTGDPYGWDRKLLAALDSD